MRQIMFKAIVVDFLLAREPLTTLYRFLQFQKVPYPLPTISGSHAVIFGVSSIFKSLTARNNNRRRLQVYFCNKRALHFK